MPFDAPVISTIWSLEIHLDTIDALSFVFRPLCFISPTCLNGRFPGCYARSEAFRCVKSQDEWE